MKRLTLIIGFFYVIICGLMIVFSPDGLSRIFVIIQSVLMLLGYVFGIFLVGRYSSAFQLGRNAIFRTKREIQTDDLWLALSRDDNLFQIDSLDRDFVTYKEAVSVSKRNPNSVLPDIEDTFNEDTISIKVWRGIVNQIPETLTGVGILGTFVGLIIGIGSIKISSVAAAVTSLESMINGIEIAFYTSIVGIILSICFNLTYKFYWNVLLRDLAIFIDDFHKNVIQSEENQFKELQINYYKTMLKYYNDSENPESIDAK